MQYFLPLLALLACPVGMGLMMWLMMRGNKDQATHEANQMPMDTYSEPVEVTNESAQGASLLKTIGSCLKMCLNWKVVAGLAVVGLLVLVVAPQFIWAALPLLLVAACPLSMLFMLRGMQGGGSQQKKMPTMPYRPQPQNPSQPYEQGYQPPPAAEIYQAGGQQYRSQSEQPQAQYPQEQEMWQR